MIIKKNIFKKTIAILIILALSVLILTGCNKTDKDQTSDATENGDSITITFLATDQNGDTIANLDTSFTSNDKLIEKLKKDAGFIIKDGMVTEIGGIAQDPEQNLYWLFTVNDEFAEKGFADLEYKDGDVIHFTLTDVSE